MLLHNFLGVHAYQQLLSTATATQPASGVHWLRMPEQLPLARSAWMHAICCVWSWLMLSWQTDGCPVLVGHVIMRLSCRADCKLANDELFTAHLAAFCLPVICPLQG